MTRAEGFTVQPFRREHLESLRPGPFDRRLMADPVIKDALSRAGPESVSIMRDERCLGMLMMGQEQDVGTVVLIGSDELRERHPVQLGVALAHGIKRVPELGIRTLRAGVDPSFAAAKRLLISLGFYRLPGTQSYVRFV